MLVAQNPPGACKRLSVVRLGLGEAALLQEKVAHVVDREQRVGVLVAQDAAADLELPLDDRLRLGVASNLCQLLDPVV